MFVGGLGLGIMFSRIPITNLLIENIAATEKGKWLGINNAAGGLGRVIGPLIIGNIYATMDNRWLIFLVTAGFSAFLLLFSVYVWAKMRAAILVEEAAECKVD